MSKTTPAPTPAYRGKAPQPVVNTLAWRQQQVAEAADSYAYWKQLAATSENAHTRAQAKGLARIWKTTRDTRAETLRLLGQD